MDVTVYRNVQNGLIFGEGAKKERRTSRQLSPPSSLYFLFSLFNHSIAVI
jgi:hypothetical protein